MAIDHAPFFAIYGWNVQGDFDGVTYYTSKRKGLVSFIKSPPLEPPSPTQTIMRNRFRLIATTWRGLTPEQRKAWNDMAVRASLNLHGYNLFTWWQTQKDDATIRTLEHQTGITVLT